MENKELKQLILDEKLVVILRGVPVESLPELSRALVKGGIKLLEVTFNQKSENPAAEYASSIEAIRNAVGDNLILGAGTVLTEAQVQAAFDAGAKYIISPNTSRKVIEKTRQLGMVSIPGAMTPSEIVEAWEYGADIVKLFPADDLGSHYIWNIRGPLSHIPLMCTGGVNPETIPIYFKAGADSVGTGISIVDKQLLAKGDYEGITELARQHVQAIAEYKNKQN